MNCEYNQDNEVRKVLKKIARNHNLSYKKVTKDFAYGCNDFVIEFWTYIYNIYGDLYNKVDFCSDCKKFEMSYNDSIDNMSTMLKYLRII